MPSINDGGKWALAGYLYQIVGVLGITAKTFTQSTKSPDDIDVILDIPGVGKSLKHIVHESFGQDASVFLESINISEADDSVLVQFKYSSNNGNKIDAPEMREIIDRFTKSVDAAREDGAKVTTCVLVTNREITSQGGGAQQIWDQAVQDSTEFKLQLALNQPLETFRTYVAKFGHEYGTTDDEIQKAVERLIGKIIIDTVSQESIITKEDLVQEFTGYSNTTPYTSNIFCAQSIKRLEQQKPMIGLLDQFVRREALADLGRMCKENALIVIHGGGGCGKTVTLWHSLFSSGAVAVFSYIGHIGNNVVGDPIGELANLPEYHSRRYLETTEQVINRIQIANPTTNIPLVYLGLDGLDEQQTNHHGISSIKTALQWFWKEDLRLKQDHVPHRAVMIVTCRDFEEFNQHWLIQDISGGFGGAILPVSLSVDVLTYDELADAINDGTLEAAIASKLRTTLELMNNPPPPIAGHSLMPTPNVLVSAGREIVEALRHPVVWQTFVNLEVQTQNLILDQDVTAVEKLAKRFLDRFCEKAIQRGRLDPITKDELLAVLSAIAKHCNQGAQHWYNANDWVNPPASQGLIADAITPQRIYRECLSHGLIIQDKPKSWRWLYDWIRGYLINLS